MSQSAVIAFRCNNSEDYLVLMPCDGPGISKSHRIACIYHLWPKISAVAKIVMSTDLVPRQERPLTGDWTMWNELEPSAEIEA